ncbi:MAG: S8 family serine peptidase [Proteobacteria bacterium]|jgi:subtilisin family serine protease|nr:S8 family serine peptidase [Pseudomonadota bacterium]
MIHGRITTKFLAAGMTLLSLSAWASQPEAVPGEYIVKLKPNISTMSLRSLQNQIGAEIKSTIPSGNLLVVRKPMVMTAQSAVKTLSQNELVEFAEPNFIYRINKTPNDPSLGRLWGLKNIGQTDGRANGVAGVDVDAERAWDIETGNKDIIVAVIDTGVDYNHPDLKDNMWRNEEEAKGKAGVDDDGNGYVDDIYGYNFSAATAKPDPMDDHGHGSHCSGTIGAKGNDGKGIVGVAWDVRIMAVKFLAASGGGTLEGAIKSIDYAVQNGADILSNSWGGGGESQALKEAIERSNAAGTLFVAAAGNDGTSNDADPHFPSNYTVPNVLSVAAIDNKGALASFSNFGKRTVHVAAPGVNIYSSLQNGKYDSWSGTSMATPHVSGVAALLASYDNSLTALQIKERIMKTSKPFAGVRGKITSGGVANAFFALTNQQSPPDPNDPSNWTHKTLAISSAHPYLKNTNESYEVNVTGAKEMALYFEKFDTERGYDKVTLLDRAGNKLAEMSGSLDEAYSVTISGDYVKVVFTADDSVEKYGFDLTKVAYR